MPLFKAFLPHRAILEVQGEDRAAFLQGLITNDIKLASPTRTIYTAFLTPQGRFLYDFFISEEGESYFLETEAASLETLQRKLSLYKLRSRVSLIPRFDLPVFALWGDLSPLPLSHEKEGVSQLSLFVDPRLSALGLRGRGEMSFPNVQLASPEDYALHRLPLGVPEAGLDLLPEKTIPLEAGLDDLHDISWTKGCYMGQELTSRTKHRGLVRKRLIPVKIEGSLPPSGTKIFKEDEIVGEMRSVAGSYGLALLRLEALEAPQSPLSCEDASLTPVMPSWMTLETP